ncbi:YbhB/YbcL family Raf kinase inhibitor-like protein [Allonocardiopsis opalescens]|uniref:PBP family phospholipid-binding protein n=1 Tax=Allonocardiopsis opalescens TaxID=1144618 RepID=A0A2T0PU80_9ACTN|nr:YbhB/YbcL family Raf kinase inhibitor-like protein [Allonocardiopsis opalescens]PRX92450.1 hypothetical protein CLV72_110210 [Allonocardiopsis opalescens]
MTTAMPDLPTPARRPGPRAPGGPGARTAARWAAALLAAASLAASSGCNVLRPAAEGAGEVADDITVTSPAFRDGEALPLVYTCAGEGVAPPLRWSGLPQDVRSLALVVDTVDAGASGGAAVHWLLYGIPAELPDLAEGEVPEGAGQAVNSSGQPGYHPPCPPEGASANGQYEYRFTVYALDREITLPADVGLGEAIEAIGAATLARGRLHAYVAGEPG